MARRHNDAGRKNGQKTIKELTGQDTSPAGHSSEDRSFLAAFENCTLPEAAWTHLAHVRVAWLYFTATDSAAALGRLRQGIRRYNTLALDRPHRYHETVTVAFARVVASRIRPGESWASFRSRIGDVLARNSPILLQYYSATRLYSAEARQGFVEPDLRPLPEFGDDGAAAAGR